MERAGDSALSAVLEDALQVASAAPDEAQLGANGNVPLDAVRPHVHGFHVYPARLHPQTARRLIDALSAPGEWVLDPFVGSGTVAVEALAAGRQAIGNDLNPLAVELTRCKVHPWSAQELADLERGVAEVAAFAEARRQKRQGALHRYDARDVEQFPPHVLLELDGLRGGIFEQDARRTRQALLLALSSLLTKLSFSRGDAAQGQAPKRLASGHAIRLFARRGEELVHQLQAFRALVQDAHGARAPHAEIVRGDARELRDVPSGQVKLVVSSPPYAGTYDYLSHHQDKLRWLDLPLGEFASGELGSRRHYAELSDREASARWDQELGDVLDALSRVLRHDGMAVLVIGDSATRGQALRADEVLLRLAPRHGLRLHARASQDRPHFHGPSARWFRDRPRREHALLLVKAPTKS